MDIPEGTTVLDTKQYVARRFSSLVENVKLLHCGKDLKDVLVLAKQRVRPENRIVVYIREMDSILLQSCGAGWQRSSSKPLDYTERLAELARLTGHDPRICARCYQFMGYDYDRTLAELQDLPPD
jgi:hypothetical protein